MSGTITVRVRTRFPQIKAEYEAKAALVTAKAAHDLVSLAQQRARVDTGYMKGAINAQGSGLEWSVHSPAEYSIYNEFGRVGDPGQPFMLPAAEIVRPAYIAALKRLI